MPFTAPTAANISSCLVISAAKSFPLSSLTRIKAGEYFVYKSVLQVTSSNLRIQHTYMLLQAIVLFLLLCPPCFVTSQSGRFGRYSGDASFVRDPFITPTHKAKPPSSAQLLRMLHQPSFKVAFTASSSIVVIVQSLSQPHSSTPVWQPGYCPRTFFRLAGRFLSHIPRYSVRQARKPITT